MPYMPNLKVRAFERVDVNGSTKLEPTDSKTPLTPIDYQMIMSMSAQMRKDKRVECIAHSPEGDRWHDEYTLADAITRLYTGFIDTVVFFGQSADYDVFTIIEAI